MNYKLLISHRGNTLGPDLDNENNPAAIAQTINSGFDCEVDLRVVESKIFLGHDWPQFQIELSFLNEFRDKLWIHCKNFEALAYMNSIDNSFNYFWHQNDMFTLTSKGYIWTFPGNEYFSNSVIVNLYKNLVLETDCYGICSDYVSHY